MNSQKGIKFNLMGDFTFQKTEKLSREKWIKELFKRGSSFYLHPFKVIYLDHPDPQAMFNQVLISVPTRNFKRAVDRNTIKRRIRETWRLNKNQLVSDKKWLIAYIYTAKEILPSSVILAKLPMTFKTLIGTVDEKKD